MLNMVTALDGATTLGGRSSQLGDDDDRSLFMALRAASDVVLVGASTVRTEDYGPIRLPEGSARRLTAGLSPVPRLAIMSRSLDLEASSKVFSDLENPPYLLTGARAPADRLAALADRAVVLVAGEDGVDVVQALALLRDRGHQVVLCEGGPSVNGQLLAADLVDEINLTISPLAVVGESSRVTRGEIEVERHFRLERLLAGERMLFARYLKA